MAAAVGFETPETSSNCSINGQTQKPAQPTTQSILSAATNIIKFKGDNFRLWKAVIVSFLKGTDLYKYVDGSYPCPAPLENGESNPSTITWLQQDQLTLTVLFSSLSDSILGQVVNYSNSAQVWKYLHDFFEATTNAQICQLHLQLASIVKSPDESITTYFNRAKSLVDSLAITSHVVGDREFQSYLLKGLPHDYSALVSTILTRSTPCPPSQIYGFMLSTEAWLQQQKHDPISDITLNSTTYHSTTNPSTYNHHKTHTTSNNTRSSDSRGKQFNTRGRGRAYTSSHCHTRSSSNHTFAGTPDNRPLCQICGKKGHAASVCYHRFNQSYQARPPPSFTANATSTTPSWLADTAASHHFSGDLAQLNLHSSDYSGTDTISLGDGSAVPIAAHGNENVAASDNMVTPKAALEDRRSSETITILTYNVWFREDLEMVERMRAIGNLIHLHSPDVICLQEVTPDIYGTFQKSGWWQKYQCSVSPQLAQARSYFCMLLAKVPVKSFSRKPFNNTMMSRELCISEVDLKAVDDKSTLSLVVATSHLESPCPAPPKWDQMYSKERVEQAKESVNHLENHPNVVFCGDMNWDDKLDGSFPLKKGWVDAWAQLRPNETGFTYDTKSNKMLTGNRTLQKRLDRCFCSFQDFKLSGIEMIGMKEIPCLSYTKEKKTKAGIKKLVLPVLPSDHFGLLMTITRHV